MAEAPVAHVQVKGDVTATEMVSPHKAPGPLAPNSIRVRPSILALSSNTTSYSVMGAILGWWDTYPVNEDLPSPYNDREQYGIGPAWGFANVLESTTDIAPGTFIRGFLPLSSIPVDLCLKRGEVPDEWIEISPHRAKVMSIYHRYVVSDKAPNSKAERDAMALEALLDPLWGSAWMLNKFSFGTEAPIIHPGGGHQPWSASDADLSHATMILLTASSKTAMALARELRHGRKADSGPQKIVGITSDANVDFVKKSKWYDTVLTYTEALREQNQAVLETTQSSQRVVVLDFGARGSFTSDLHGALETTGLPTTFIRVGGEKTVGKQAGSPGGGQQVDMVQMNASGLLDQAREELGAAQCFEAQKSAREAFFEKGAIAELEVSWYKGMKGPNGLEGAWNRLCQYTVPASEVVAVWVDAQAEGSEE